MKVFAFPVGVAIAVAALNAQSFDRAGSTSQAARFERSPCAIDVAKDERIDCGTLIVPERRDKAESRLIRLPVTIFRSRAATPLRDPILFMPGGPGASAVAGWKSGKDLPFLDAREFIVLEPRGARHASPALECPGINTLTAEIAAGRVTGAAAQTQFAEAASACRATLAAAGADLDAYTTRATADDIEDLRKALGYETWNLQGVSYSTKLMLTVARRYPSRVRSLVLDSVLPPDVNFDEMATANLQRALDLVFDQCAVDRQCAAAYPDLRTRFADLVAAADRRPLPLPLAPADAGGRPAVIRGAQVVEAIYNALHSPQTIPLIPRIISDAAAGQYGELLPLVKGNQGPSSFTWGLRLSVWCGEEMPFEDPARIDAQTSRALGLGGIDERAASPATCRAWNVATAPDVESTPVRTDVPALIFAGEFDPDTPPMWGRGLLAFMPNAVYVEMRGRSHSAGFNACGGQIVTAFLRSPAGPLPVECALKLGGADFSRSARAPGGD